MNQINELYQKHVSYELQTLDTQSHNLLNKNKIHQKVLAFLSELGKVSEESRCFSFWDSSSVDNLMLLEYYIDSLQLLLSIGFELHVDAIKQYPELHQEIMVMDQFLKVYHATLALQQTYQFEDYQNVMDDFIHLGFLLGFDMNQIISAYQQKI